MTFRSPTPQIQSPHAWTYAGLAIEPDGSCIAAERNGLRAIKPKGLVVRYANPFESDAPPESLYECSEPFQTMWRSPSGVLHATGKRHHHNGAGKWTKPKEPRAFNGKPLLTIGGVDHEHPYLLAADFDGISLFPFDGSGYGEEIKLNKSHQMGLGVAGTPEDLYVSTDDALMHIADGVASAIDDVPGNPAVYYESSEVVWLVANGLYKGNARDGFKLLQENDELVPSGDFAVHRSSLGERVFYTVTHGESRGLWELKGGTPTQLLASTGHCGAPATGDKYLWIPNGIELLCFNGTEWRSVPRIYSDQISDHTAKLIEAP